MLCRLKIFFVWESERCLRRRNKRQNGGPVAFRVNSLKFQSLSWQFCLTKSLLSLTRCPVDCLNWHPRFVSVDFIRMQNDRSKPLYLLLDWIDIDDDTEMLKFPLNRQSPTSDITHSYHLDSWFRASFHRPTKTATPCPANAPLDSDPVAPPPRHGRLDGRNQIYCCLPFQPGTTKRMNNKLRPCQHI